MPPSWGGDEAVVLFSGNASHGLEPMGIMGYALFDRPVLHCVGDHSGNLGIKAATLVDGLLERLVGILGQTLLHDSIIKYVAAKKLIHVCHMVSSSLFLQ